MVGTIRERVISIFELASQGPDARSGQWRTSVLGASESTVFEYSASPRLLSFHPKLVDHYTRGGDLVMRYDQQEGKPFSLQLDYRVVDYSDDPHDLVMELWVSVETTLLSSYPTVHVLFDVGGPKLTFGGWRIGKLSRFRTDWPKSSRCPISGYVG